MPIKILIVDDLRLFRQGLRGLLEQEQDFEVVGEAADGQDAFTMVADTEPDIVLMDVSMPKLDGIQATRMIMERHPSVKILMLSLHTEDEKVVAAIRAGAAGYVLKDADHKEFVRIIKSTFAGEAITSPFLANLAPRVRAKCLDPSRTDAEIKIKIKERFSLTVREGEILELLLKGKSNKEIADLTYVSTETVKSHLQNIYRKLGVKSRLEAVALCLKEQE
jgi:two-component system response regulator DegU